MQSLYIKCSPNLYSNFRTQTNVLRPFYIQFMSDIFNLNVPKISPAAGFRAVLRPQRGRGQTSWFYIGLKMKRRGEETLARFSHTMVESHDIVTFALSIVVIALIRQISLIDKYFIDCAHTFRSFWYFLLTWLEFLYFKRYSLISCLYAQKGFL